MSIHKKWSVFYVAVENQGWKQVDLNLLNFLKIYCKEYVKLGFIIVTMAINGNAKPLK